MDAARRDREARRNADRSVAGLRARLEAAEARAAAARAGLLDCDSVLAANLKVLASASARAYATERCDRDAAVLRGQAESARAEAAGADAAAFREAEDAERRRRLAARRGESRGGRGRRAPRLRRGGRAPGAKWAAARQISTRFVC